MEYLVNKETHVVNLNIMYDSQRHLWLDIEASFDNPDIFCKEGEENQYGYIVEDVPEKEMFMLLANGYSGNFYCHNGQLSTDKVINSINDKNV